MIDGELPRTLAAELGASPGARVRLCGWAHAVESSLDPKVVILRDHTGLAELVVNTRASLGNAMDGIVPESAIEAVGAVDEGAHGEARVAVERLDVVAPALGALPIGESSSLEERLDWRYLDLRRPRNRLIFEVQTTVLSTLREVWYEQGFMELQSPKLRPIPNKSGTTLFSVDHFGRRAYLAQSPQFYKQMAMAAGFDRVFEVGPVFRPQPRKSSRHDTEFTSIDVEISWIRSHEDLLEHAEELLRRVILAVRAQHGERIVRWFGVELALPSTPFPRVTLAEAKRLVEATGWSAGGPSDDLDAEGERRVARHVADQHGHEFVFVTDYPEPARPFYHMRCTEDSLETRSFDLIWNGLEIMSGAQREHRHGRLLEQARARGIPIEVIGQYLDFFRFGSPPHGGFGLGLTRLIMSMLGVGDVREATYLFRGPDRLTP